MKKQLFRLIAFLFFVVFFSSWALLTVNALGPIRSTPSFSASFNNNLTSSWGSFFNHGPFTHGCSSISNLSITSADDCAYFQTCCTFSNGQTLQNYAYRRLSSPITVFNHLGSTSGDTSGATIECSLKLESMPKFNSTYSTSSSKIGQTGFIINIRMNDFVDGDAEFYFCIYRNPNNSNTILVSSYSGDRYSLSPGSLEVSDSISYDPNSFIKFVFVYDRNADDDKIQLYVDGIHKGSFSDATHRGNGGLAGNFVYFSLVSRPLFSTPDLVADSRVKLDYVNIFDKPMPQPSSLANVPLYGQEARNTCGAASIRMVLASLGIYRNETVIYNEMIEPGTENTERALNTILEDCGRPAFNRSATWISQSGFVDRMQNNLVFGYPVIVFVRIKNNDSTDYFGYSLNTETGGHVVVVSGMKIEDGTTYFEIHDPFSYMADTNNPNQYRGQVVWIPASVLYQAFTEHSNTTISYIY